MRRIVTFGIASVLLVIETLGQVPVPPGLARTLRTALADERYSHALYDAAVLRFGGRAPFSNIVYAEQMHARMIEELMFRYGIAVPRDDYTRLPKETVTDFAKRLKLPPTFLEACRKAAKLERDQGPLYDRLAKSAPEDVKAVFEKLKAVSLERHLRAFERQIGSPP